MKKSLYKSLIPKGLSVAILSANLMSSQLMSVYANEQVDENVNIEELTELESESIPENLEKSESIDGQSNDEALLEEDSIEEESFESESASETDLSEIPDTEEDKNEESPELSTKVIDVYLNKYEFIPGETVELTVIFEGEADYLHVEYLSDKGIELLNSTYNIQNIGENQYIGKLEYIMPDAITQNYYLSHFRVKDKNENYIYFYQHDIPFNINFNLHNPDYEETKQPEILEVHLEEDTIYKGESTNLVIISDYGESVDYVDAILIDESTGFEYQYSTNGRNNFNYILQDGTVKTVLQIPSFSLQSGKYKIKRILFLDKYNQYHLYRDIGMDVELTLYDVVENYQEKILPFETIYQYNPNLTVGIQNVIQEGKDGIHVIQEEVIYLRKDEISRNKIINDITSPINKIIEVGTKALEIENTAKVEKEMTRTEEISYEIKYVDNPHLLVGIEEVTQEGVNGVRTITELVTTIGGKEINRKPITDEITIAPINKIVQVGAKELKIETKDHVIPFKTEYVVSEDLLVGEESVVQEGKDGILQKTYEVAYVVGVEQGREFILEKQTLKPVNKIIAKGVKEIKQETQKSAIPFKTKKIDNDNLLVGQEEVSQKGQDGELTTTYEVIYLRGKEDSRTKVSEETTKEAVTHIIQVGTKEIKEEVKTAAIPFETEYIENPDLLVTESNELTAGVDGSREVTYEVTYIKGQETDRKEVASKTLVDPITRVVEVGSKEVKTESKESPIPFETEYLESADLLEGQENIKQKGEDGTLLTTYQVTYVNGEEVDREETASEVTLAPTTQIIEKGIRQVKEESKTEVVPFETKRVDNPDMLVGEEKVTQEGVDGERTITENVYFVHGEEVDRQEKSNEITLQPIKQIIEVGVKEVKTQDITEDIEFETEYIENADWLEETQEILTPGANGEALVTYEITYINGVESGRKELNRVILVDPTTQVIEKGTKEAPKPAEGEQNTPGKDKPAKATLPETGEQGSHAIFTAASLAILAGLGLVVGGRKKEEE